MGRYVSYINYALHLSHVKDCWEIGLDIATIAQHYRDKGGSPHLYLSTYTFLTSLSIEFGNVYLAKRLYMQSLYGDITLHNSTHRGWAYKELSQRQSLLQQSLQRTRNASIRYDQDVPPASSRVHFVTYASNHTVELTALLQSASFAGIPLQVVGKSFC